MLIELLLDLLKVIFDIIMGLLGVLPDLPESIITALDEFFNLIFQGMNLVSFFLPMDTVKVLIPLVIAIINFDKIWKLVMFIIKKIPFLGMK
jgi:hypothetical protein